MMRKNKSIFRNQTVVAAICLLVLLSISAIAESDFLIRGYVQDYQGVAIYRARIFIDEGKNPADLTETNGSYEAATTKGVHKVTAKKKWYRPSEREVAVKDKKCKCDLKLRKITTAKIGAVFSGTGQFSIFGDPQIKTAKMIVEQINKAGGIDGHKVELLIYDDEGDVSKSKMGMEELIRKDEVIAVIGPSLSSLTLASIPLAEEYKTPLISCGSSPMIVYNKKTGRPYKWVFKIAPSTNMAVESIYANLKEKGIKKIAIINDTTNYGKNGYRELDRLVSHYGLEIVAKASYDPKDTDMTAQLTKLKGSAPETLINWSWGQTQALVLQQWYKLSMKKIPFYQSPAFNDPKIIESAGKAAEGVLCPQQAWAIPKILPYNNPQKEITMRYLKSYTEYYNKPISLSGSYAWDATKLVVDAIKTVGPDRVEIRDYIESKKGFVGQNGIFNFSADNHNGLTKEAFYMTVLRDGQWALVGN